MSKRTKWAVLIGAAAAVVSAVVLLILFWDKLLEKFPCFGCGEDYEICPEGPVDEVLPFEQEDPSDYADLGQAQE